MVEAKGARIVVGVDGSEPSKAALRWATRYAEQAGGRLDAVLAWDYPPNLYGWVPEDSTVFADGAAETLDKTLGEVLGSEPTVQVHRSVEQGDAAEVLLEAAKRADLLVVGNRGHGAFARALMGSVSNRCVHHATCPVVVVRESGA